MKQPRLEALRRDLQYDHWQHVYNWDGLDKTAVALTYDCSLEQVNETMRDIEKKHPKPNKTKDEELAEKSPNNGTCRSCGAPVVWNNKGAKNHPCNPKILKVVLADGSVVSGRESHFSTCPQANFWRKK